MSIQQQNHVTVDRLLELLHHTIAYIRRLDSDQHRDALLIADNVLYQWRGDGNLHEFADTELINEINERLAAGQIPSTKPSGEPVRWSVAEYNKHKPVT